MTIVGELTAGDVVKTTDEKCRTCGIKAKLTPAGYCFDPHACTERRKSKARGTQNLRHPCLVRKRMFGSMYYLREFGPPNPLPKGFTVNDYSDKGRVYYEAILEKGSATTFAPQDALALAKMFDGVAVNKEK